jgi:catechol 2,3-dioxygenase-like lactoylglutathione lyase family enzyme
MKLSRCSTALFVKNISVSKAFYTGMLGLSIDMDFGKNVIFKEGFTIWEINENHIIPQTLGLDSISDRNSIRFELYFETENIKEAFDNLKSKKVHFLHEIHEEPWGQLTFRFFDPDRHLIEAGESMPHFIGRFYDEGLTIEQISARTSVPAEAVRQFLGLKE